VTRVRPTLLAFLAVAWLLIVDSVNRFSVGPATLSALLTFGSVVLMGLLALTSALGGDTDPELAVNHRRVVPPALALFALWAVCALPFNWTSPAIQNVTVYLGFVLAIAVTGRWCTPEAAEKLLGQIQWVGWVVGLIYLVTVLRGGLGGAGLYGARTFALSAAVLLAVAVVRRRSRLLPLLLLADIVFSLSRTGTAVGILVLVLALALRGTSRVRMFRIAAFLAVGAAGALVVFTKFTPLRDRFLGGDQAFSYGATKFNVSGRTEIWKFTWQSAQHHLWFGAGPGSAETAVSRQFITVNHPHDDYLRLIHDFGLIGLALFVIGFASLLHRTWRNGRQTGEPIHWVAFLSLISVAGSALTDNVLVYSFVMFPVGILVGASLSGTPSRSPTDGRTADSRLGRRAARPSSTALRRRSRVAGA